MPRFIDLPYHLAETIHETAQRKALEHARAVTLRRKTIGEASQFIVRLMVEEKRLAELHRGQPEKLRNALKALPKYPPAWQKRREAAAELQEIIRKIETTLQHRDKKQSVEEEVKEK